MFLSGLAVNTFMLFWTRSATGITKANTIPVHGSLLADTYPISGPTRMSGLNNLIGHGLSLASPILVGGIAAWAGGLEGWRWAWFAGDSVSIVGIAAFWLHEPPRGQFEKLDVIGEVNEDEDPAPISMEAAFARIKKIRTLQTVLVLVDLADHIEMGAVYKARDTLLDRVLAIKVLRADVASPTRERRFIQEARTASSLNHPNIVTIYEIFHVGDSPCIAMEYVSGETLEHRLEKGRLSLRTGLDWGTALADALARAHEAGIVHRDVKPSNIMINDQGLVKILDFGLAKLLELSDESEHGERLTQEGKFVGTPPYLSPEQALGDKVDARSDIFSLGTVLFEMFTGQRAFERYTNVEMVTAVVREQPKKIRAFVPELPAYLEKIIAQCLEKKPERRIQRMQEVKEALENVRQTDSLSRLLAAQPPPPFWKTWKAWAAAALLATIITGGSVFWWGRARYRGSGSASVMTRITSDEGLTTDPAVSPDGKFLAYASDRGGESLDIWIQPLSGGEAVKLTNHAADDHQPVFSPDGSKIAFRSERDGGGIYTTSILGGSERLLVHKGRDPRFSPDGKWLLYWVGFSTGDPTSPGSNKIFIVPAEGGTPKELVPNSSRLCTRFGHLMERTCFFLV